MDSEALSGLGLELLRGMGVALTREVFDDDYTYAVLRPKVEPMPRDLGGLESTGLKTW